ncbi:MFS transporter [Nonomuraea sp. NPDC003201]
MAIAPATAAWAFSASRVTDGRVALPDPQGLIALVAANAFVLFFALSWGVVVWVLLGEMFPNRIRAAALGVAAAAQWLANWLISVSFPALAAWNLPITYGGYAVMALLSFIFVARWIRETKGRKLDGGQRGRGGTPHASIWSGRAVGGSAPPPVTRGRAAHAKLSHLIHHSGQAPRRTDRQHPR